MRQTTTRGRAVTCGENRDVEPRKTTLTKGTTDPDKYAVMIVKDSMAPFQFKAVIFEPTELANELDCLDELALARMLSFKPQYEAERLDPIVDFLRPYVVTKEEKMIAERFIAFTYMGPCIVSSFLSRFLDKKARLA
jgi:hypothetical protein